MKKLTTISTCSLIFITACSAGSSGSSVTPFTLPYGSYDVATTALGNGIETSAQCLAEFAFLLPFSMTTATSNGTGTITIQMNGTAIPFNLNYTHSPCASWSSNNVTYTLSQCVFNPDDNSLSATLTTSDESPLITQSGCHLVTIFNDYSNINVTQQTK